MGLSEGMGREDARRGEAADAAEVAAMKARIEAVYNFSPTDTYVADLIAFVDGMLAEVEGLKGKSGKRRRK